MHVQMLSRMQVRLLGRAVRRGVEPPMTDWRKSARSGAQGNCVELAVAPDDVVLVRNSRFPAGPVLRFGAADMAGFIRAVKAGDLDDLITEDGA